jgi:creatinine amidohydrolase/Fe(II)-dependent formamide hydrolase-like protein
VPRLAALALAGWLGLAAAAPSVQIEELTWTELRARVAGGASIALVPIGGTEQNGPHMVLGKHNVRARMLAQRIAQRLGNALVAPVVAYVPEGSIEPPGAHMRFPGTITVPDAAFEAVLASAARSLQHAGFRDVVFLCDHGGYLKQAQRAAVRLPHVHAPAEYYAASQDGFAELLRARGFSAAEIGRHAGLADTSLALAVDPSLVRVEALAGTRPDAHGVAGDPRRASADLGRAGAEHVIDATVAAIRALTGGRRQ